jgi:hypothetical protein
MTRTDVDDLSHGLQEMFVQVGTTVSSGDGWLTIGGLGASTLYFSDRPERVVGHLSNAQFVDTWGQGDDSFASDPPNAALSFVEPTDESPHDVVLLLRDPVLGHGAITYSIEVLEGDLPRRGGPCTLFIDPVGRPLSPVSVAGVLRRERRRGRP